MGNNSILLGLDFKLCWVESTQTLVSSLMRQYSSKYSPRGPVNFNILPPGGSLSIGLFNPSGGPSPGLTHVLTHTQLKIEGGLSRGSSLLPSACPVNSGQLGFPGLLRPPPRRETSSPTRLLLWPRHLCRQPAEAMVRLLPCPFLSNHCPVPPLV